MHVKNKIFAVVLFAAAAAGASAQDAAFTGRLDSFLNDINKNLPDNAVSSSTWSDGYIGELISLPPHLGLGVSCGISRFPLANLVNAAGIAGSSVDIPILLTLGDGFLINPAVELRLGGFKLPFDLGARFGMLPANTLYGVEMKYRSISVDMRYAIIKESSALPDIIVGAGWYNTSGRICHSFSADELAAAGSQSLAIDFKTNVFELRAQVSKSALAFAPYLGLAGYFAMSESSYEIAGVKGEREENHFGSRVYGGLSFNIFVVKIDVSASYNFVTQNWGGNLGVRLQL